MRVLGSLQEDNVCLTLRSVCRYLLEVLTQYSKLMVFDVDLHPDVLPIEMVVLRPSHLLDAGNRTCTFC